MVRISVFILFLSIFISCKKCKENSISLTNSRWDLFFKNNSTFTFYAESELYFITSNSVLNYRNFDTLSGNWILDNNKLSIEFNNDDQYTSDYISQDSLSGTLKASGNNGVWYAKRK